MVERYPWRTMDDAPRNGAPIKIRGRRFITERRYYATAVWATRHCPEPVTDWFPVEPDAEGPYTDVTDWMSLN